MMSVEAEDEDFVLDLFEEGEQWMQPQSSTVVESFCPQMTPPTVVKRVYHLGRALTKVFEDTNLHYWTSGKVTISVY